jgi:hypothetical protein
MISRKEKKVQKALGLAQKCIRCHKVKILQDFPTLEAEDGLPEIISEQCHQCFEEEVRQVDKILQEKSLND